MCLYTPSIKQEQGADAECKHVWNIYTLLQHFRITVDFLKVFVSRNNLSYISFIENLPKSTSRG